MTLSSSFCVMCCWGGLCSTPFNPGPECYRHNLITTRKQAYILGREQQLPRLSDESAIPTLEPSVHCSVAQYAHSIMLAVDVNNLLRLNNINIWLRHTNRIVLYIENGAKAYMAKVTTRISRWRIWTNMQNLQFVQLEILGDLAQSVTLTWSYQLTSHCYCLLWLCYKAAIRDNVRYRYVTNYG